MASVLSLSLVIAGTVTMALTPGSGCTSSRRSASWSFFSGGLLALLIRSGWRCPVPLPVAALSAGVAYALLTAGNRGGHPLGNGVEDAVILSHLWVVRLGEWSFALYRTHWLLLELVVHLDPGSKARSVALHLLEGGAFVLVAVAVSAAAYTWFEKPLEKRLRGCRPRPEMVEDKELAAAVR
jgi:peptidoglycan/LPS O-acetylase OafA/YrhL